MYQKFIGMSISGPFCSENERAEITERLRQELNAK